MFLGTHTNPITHAEERYLVKGFPKEDLFVLRQFVRGMDIRHIIDIQKNPNTYRQHALSCTRFISRKRYR
ncbi:MAG: hypothetical protein EXS67_00810 [Candidatus Margulisbacteria bacterium]|nr:hypothetical protein [Candidatus Margulisiibacteriota bacterium]